MKNAFYIIIMKFGEAVGMESEFVQSAFAIAVAVLAVSLLLCFFGKKTIRIFAGIMAFVLCALALITLMKNAGIGEKVTAFSVLGLIAASVTMRWYRVSAFIIAGIIGYSIVATFSNILWLNISAAIVLGVLANIFPVYGIIILTSIWGGLVIGFEGDNILNLGLSSAAVAAIGAAIAALGFTVQYFMNKELLKMPLKQRRFEVSK
ncbi:MAG: hypothetical protein AB1Z23_00935 [Eubacteriales bacterium]